MISPPIINLNFHFFQNLRQERIVFNIMKFETIWNGWGPSKVHQVVWSMEE
jgi:hypothetical protein